MSFTLKPLSKFFPALALSVISCLTYKISSVNSVTPNQIKPQLPFVVAAIPDLPGWRNTRWGMSMEQVKSMYPFTDGVEGAPDNLRMVGKTNIVIDDHTYRVRFVFLNSYGLESVNFASDLSEVDSYRVRKTVADELQARYGKPDEKSELFTPSPYVTMRWYLPTTFINYIGTQNRINFGYSRNDQRF
jgi:hypothetical protein